MGQEATRPDAAESTRGARADAMAHAPIGLIDSGVGGLTVARAVLDQLPGESLWYVGDTARGPYGGRSLADVRSYSLELLSQLVDGGVKALVIACNTASAAVLRDARLEFDVPVFEVIVPAARRAAAVTRSGRIGVIGTRATIESKVYEDALAANPGLHVVGQACPEFVDFVEAGVTAGPELLACARGYLEPLVAQGIDTMILGCTHYPFLAAVIQFVVGDAVTLVSSAEETAKDVYRGLTQHGLLAQGSNPAHRFEATGDPLRFAGLASRFLGLNVQVPDDRR